MKSYLAAMSGGVDSSVALFLTRQAAAESNGTVAGITLALAAEASIGAAADRQNALDAAAVCENQDVPHTVLPAHDAFSRAVMDYFAGEYLAGRTPNPCVVCNREIKFGLLLDYALSHGFDTLVTGHYARLEQIGGTVWLRKAADPAKDQSYMLAMLTQEQLSHAHFPLGGLTKAEVREMAAEQGFASAHRRDSQDICFIPGGDYVPFVTAHTGVEPVPGDYVDESGAKLGVHKGYWCYTIGQRKGLGISMGRHIFVLGKDAAANRVTLGDEDRLLRRQVRVTSLHFPADPDVFDTDDRCTAKLRYAHREAPAVFHRTGENEGVLEFDEPQRAPSPGQFAVLYRDDCVLAAGVIA